MKFILMLLLVQFNQLSHASENLPSLSNDDEAILKNALEHAEDSDGKFSVLVRSTMDLMGPQEDEQHQSLAAEITPESY
jgi:thiamine biosynthesis lipoprotein ApbE